MCNSQPQQFAAESSVNHSIDDTPYVLGYGFMNVVGLGPNITPYKHLRGVKNRGVSRIVKLAGPNMAGLQKSAVEHCLIVGVRRAEVDVSTLATDITKPFQAVKAGGGGVKFPVILFNGQHRLSAVSMVLKPALKALHEIGQQLKRSPDNRDLQEQEQKAHQYCYNHGSWLVKVYDLGNLISLSFVLELNCYHRHFG